MTVWLERTLILAIHERQIAEHGGEQDVRDEGLLESALARPFQLDAHGEPAPDLADLAAALAQRLARNHPFLDGNKRAATVACEVFLKLNGVDLMVDDVALYPQYLGLAEDGLSAEDFAAWLRKHIVVIGSGRVQEPAEKHTVDAS